MLIPFICISHRCPLGLDISKDAELSSLREKRKSWDGSALKELMKSGQSHSDTTLKSHRCKSDPPDRKRPADSPKKGKGSAPPGKGKQGDPVSGGSGVKDNITISSCDNKSDTLSLPTSDAMTSSGSSQMLTSESEKIAEAGSEMGCAIADKSHVQGSEQIESQEQDKSENVTQNGVISGKSEGDFNSKVSHEKGFSSDNKLTQESTDKMTQDNQAICDSEKLAQTSESISQKGCQETSGNSQYETKSDNQDHKLEYQTKPESENKVVNINGAQCDDNEIVTNSHSDGDLKHDTNRERNHDKISNSAHEAKNVTDSPMLPISSSETVNYDAGILRNKQHISLNQANRNAVAEMASKEGGDVQLQVGLCNNTLPPPKKKKETQHLVREHQWPQYGISDSMGSPSCQQE